MSGEAEVLWWVQIHTTKAESPWVRHCSVRIAVRATGNREAAEYVKQIADMMHEPSRILVYQEGDQESEVLYHAVPGEPIQQVG